MGMMALCGLKGRMGSSCFGDGTGELHWEGERRGGKGGLMIVRSFMISLKVLRGRGRWLRGDVEAFY